ncbi:MAG: cytochrome B6, partial [Nitrosospira sp.]|nr:cytochrome B6 [Nitrosospira sp.]
MKKVNVLMLGLGLASLGAGMNSAMSQSDNETRPPNGQPRDAIMRAQTVRETPATRPEEKKSEHDRSNVFDASNAMPASPAFDNQPDDGKALGFDFYRDPLNAKKPMQTFEEIMRADVADLPKVMKTQHALLLRRYDLSPRLDPEAKMSRGKPLAVGPTARLTGGTTWQKLASMSPAEIRGQNLFPYPT